MKNNRFIKLTRRSGNIRQILVFLAAIMVITAVIISAAVYNNVRTVFKEFERAVLNENKEVLRVIIEKTLNSVKDYFDNIETNLLDFSSRKKSEIKTVLETGTGGREFNGALYDLFKNIAYGKSAWDGELETLPPKERFLSYAKIGSVMLVNAEGKCVERASDDGKDWIKGKDFSNKALYTEAKTKKRFFISSIVKDPVKGVDDIYAGVPLRDGEKFLGVLAAEIKREYLRKEIAGYKKHDYREAFCGFIISYQNKKPVIVVHHDSSNDGEDVRELDIKKALSASGEKRILFPMTDEVIIPDDVYGKMKETEKPVIEETISPYGKPEIFAGVNIFGTEGHDWFLMGNFRNLETRAALDILRKISVNFSIYTVVFIAVLIGIFFWFSRRREVERLCSRELEESARKYRMVTEDATDIVWRADINGNIIFATPAAGHILGYTAKEMGSMNMKDILTRHSYETWEKKIKTHIEKISGNEPGETQVLTMELEHVRADSSIVWCEVSCKIIKSEEEKEGGPSIEISGITRDISDRKSLQRSLIQAEKMAAVGTMAASVAHELRNPLGVINVALYNLNRNISDKDEKVKRHLGNMAKKVKEANKIINDLLNYSRVSDANKTVSDVNIILEEALGRVSIGFSENHIRVMKAFGKIPKVKVDNVQIGEVFQNIIKNAYEAMPDGGDLTLSTQYNEKDKAVEVSIKDTGIGIPKEDLDKLDKPFVSSKARGTGLGLALSYRIIRELHSGDIKAKSQLKKGTEFIISIPMTDLI